MSKDDDGDNKRQRRDDDHHHHKSTTPTTGSRLALCCGYHCRLELLLNINIIPLQVLFLSWIFGRSDSRSDGSKNETTA